MESLPRTFVAHTATPAKWLIVLGMAYTLAGTVLFIATPRETDSAQPSQPVAGTVDRPRPATDLDSILGANLFGMAHANAVEQAAADSENLVETRLPLVLHGVFVADDPETSTAILARQGRSEAVYHIGDQVPGNATLEAVRLDHVLLRRGRSRERLTFPNPDTRLATPSAPQEAPTVTSARASGTGHPENQRPAKPASPEAARPNRQGASPAELVRRYEDRLGEDPQQVLGELGLTPVRGDGPAGYRLDRLAQSPYLRQTGLRSGDVILSINGQPVGDVDRDRLELDNVLAQGAARLEVQRGQRRFFITATLDARYPELLTNK